MAFSAPTQGEFMATLGRALRDSDQSIFGPTTMNEFLVQAMAELSSYRPREVLEGADWPLPADPQPFTDLTSIWKVDLRLQTGGFPYYKVFTIPYRSSGSIDNRAGWDFYGGQLYLGSYWTERLNALTDGKTADMRVWGYQDRDLPAGPGDEVLDMSDAMDYMCVLNHCKFLGFELLSHDRALYQQWLAATNNTDVSPTQLMGMVNLSEQTYQRSRQRNTKMRRIPSGDYITAY